MRYATVEQLTAYLPGDAPEDADRLLDRASEVIDDALLTASYAVDTAGSPTDDDVVTALSAAACAQVEFWLASDEEDDVLGPVEDVSVGGLRIKSAHTNALAPRAARKLRACPLIRF